MSVPICNLWLSATIFILDKPVSENNHFLSGTPIWHPLMTLKYRNIESEFLFLSFVWEDPVNPAAWNFVLKYEILYAIIGENPKSLRCVSKNIPDIFDCNLKTNYHILVIFGTDIPDTTCHQMII